METAKQAIVVTHGMRWVGTDGRAAEMVASFARHGGHVTKAIRARKRNVYAQGRVHGNVRVSNTHMRAVWSSNVRHHDALWKTGHGAGL